MNLNLLSQQRTLTDDEIKFWLDKDDYLYSTFQRTGLLKKDFCQTHRKFVSLYVCHKLGLDPLSTENLNILVENAAAQVFPPKIEKPE